MSTWSLALSSPDDAMWDGSIVDMYGARISGADRLSIVETITGLPAASKRGDFLRSVRENPITIVLGQTGSGKTTQLPKYLHLENPRSQIIVTQPRVIAAMENARRVSIELLSQYGDPAYSLGYWVGYRTGRWLSSEKTSPLSFHTDGLELMRQAVSGIVPQYLVLDEVHNFALSTEVLAMLRRRSRDKVKLIIMSATLDPEIFREYYREVDGDIPLIEIPGRTYPVDKDLDATGNYMERITDEFRAGNNILFYVAGKKEIATHIQKFRDIFGADAQIFPLHAELSLADKDKVMKKDPGDTRPRLIIATNVAEEAITIDYLDLVIDLATNKVSRVNNLGVPGLYTENISDAKIRQRSWRVGRTHPGRYFRFNDTPSTALPDYDETPIERDMIDRYILVLLSLWINILELLEESDARGEKSPFFHEINRMLLKISLARLQKIWALTEDHELTVMGHDLLRFPLDVYHSRMLHESIVRGCSWDIALIVAILEKKWFLSKEEGWKELKITENQESDLFAQAELFKFLTATSLTKKQEWVLVRNGIMIEELCDFADRRWTKKLYEVVNLEPLGIKMQKVQEIDECHTGLLRRFETLGIEPTTSTNVRNKKIALATGSLHDVYTYKPELQWFQNDDHEKDTDTPPVFRQGNTSTLIIKPGKYLGQPFIIGSDDQDGLRILTYITAVDSSVIRAATTASTTYAHEKYRVVQRGRRWTAVGSHDEGHISVLSHRGSTTSGATPAEERSRARTSKKAPLWDTDHSVQPEYTYDILVEDFDQTAYDTIPDAQNAFLQDIIPVFLLEENHAIKSYVLGKSPEWINIFRTLLGRFLLEWGQYYRIHFDKIKKTELSFRDDTGVLRDFLDSKDPTIRYFRIHGELPIVLAPRVRWSGGIAIGDEGVPSRSIIDEKIGFKEDLGQRQQYRAWVNFTEIQELTLRKFIAQVEWMDTPTIGEELAAFADLYAAYARIGTTEKWALNDIGKALKKMHSKQKLLHNAQKKLWVLEWISQNLAFATGKTNEFDLEILQWAPSQYAFSQLDPSYMTHYTATLRRLRSDDKRQVSRAKNMIKTRYLPAVAQTIEEQTQSIAQMESQIHLEDTPLAKDVYDAMEKIVNQLFDKDYARLRIVPKLLETTRMVLRDQLQDNVWLSEIIFRLLNQTHAATHMTGINQHAKQVKKYQDALEVVDAYAQDVKVAVDDSVDPDYIKAQREWFQRALAKLKVEYWELMNNPLYILFKKNAAKPQAGLKK